MQQSTQEPTGWVGWVAFAGFMMIMIGIFHAISGIAAIAKDQVFVIGGGSLYEEALRNPQCSRVYVTRVHETFECDTFLSEFEQDFRLLSHDGPHRDGDVEFTFEVYERRKS